MREIKFRAWNGLGVHYSDEYKHLGEQILKNFFDYNEGDKIMQYTGLKDKNGKDIYEGDIVNILKDYTEPYHGVKVKAGIVAFSDASFYIKKSYGGHYRWMDYDIEIIGNVHENKDLLDGTK